MLHLLFYLGEQRYALPVRHVVEVLPLVNIREVPHAPAGVAGIFHYRGKLVPVLDLSQLLLGIPVQPWLSSRILLVKDEPREKLYGLLVERATDTMQLEASKWLDPGVESAGAPYLGPIATDEKGMVQRIELEALLAGQIRTALDYAGMEVESVALGN